MSAYIVGIDLGTSHTVVAFTRSRTRSAHDAIHLFEIEQLVAPGEVARRQLLPSLRYHAAPGEIAPADLVLPWTRTSEADAAVVGELARVLGAKVPGRLVASAKSWLSHAAVDRQAAILPWGAPEAISKVSPVTASASYLAHVRAAWNLRFPKAPLEQQELVLTVPASFDEAARALTLQAAREAGLPTLRLLEEPQAALYDWLFRHRASLSDALADTRLVLVCDVGGGTTDLTLVRVEMHEREPRFERLAVGRHLMLGGDNMDLALAHFTEPKLREQGDGMHMHLGTAQFAQLVERCRAVKQRLLAPDAPEHVTVTILAEGSRLIGGARSVDLCRDDVERIVVDGFFPQTGVKDFPARGRSSALVAFGLPYASDPAVTRHIAAFLQAHEAAGLPDALLLNGGVFNAHAIAKRLQATLAAWRGGPLRDLHNTNPDAAVARGAVAYALARRGEAPCVGGGSPRTYFLVLEDGTQSGESPAVCLLPRGAEEGRELRLENRRFVLRTGGPVRFHLASTTAGASGHAEPQTGDVVSLNDFDVQSLPPVATVVRADSADASHEIPVELAATLTEVGTLEVDCIAADETARRWKLEFQLRADHSGTSAIAGLPSNFSQAEDAIERVFGARRRDVDAKEVKQLRRRLEALLGDRERWTTALLRPLFDALWKRARARRRSPDHERVWFSLAGWSVRPGFGDPLDAWRIEQLWTTFEQGVQHGHDTQVNAEWWTLWRRAAGGLDEQQQDRVLDDVAINIRGRVAGIAQPPRLVKGSYEDMVRLVASLERIPGSAKVEIGDWLLEQLRNNGAGVKTHARDEWTVWALGRIGARVPFYGSAHMVVPPESATSWLDALLALDWRRWEAAAAATANIARLSGDRARDLPDDARERVIERLRNVHAPMSWIERIRAVVALDAASGSTVFGEALPPGLKLVE
jgi:molecular chaperone DnaK (HSP70)